MYKIKFNTLKRRQQPLKYYQSKYWIVMSTYFSLVLKLSIKVQSEEIYSAFSFDYSITRYFYID